MQQERWAITGDIRTADAANPRARVVLVEGDRILEVGGEELLRDLREQGVRIVDVGERTVLPGFVDSHAHVEIGTLALTEMVDCRAPMHRTVADVLQTLHDNLWRAEETGWLVGQANLFFDQKLEDKRLPTREELDSVSTDVAIILRCGGHLSVLNTRGFEISGVTEYAGREGFMGGAVIEVDANNKPTGVIAELDKSLPLPVFEDEALRRGIREGAHNLFTKLGVTSVGEISESLAGLEAMDSMIGAGEMPLRMSVLLWTPGTMTFDQALDWESHLTLRAGDDWVDVRGVKMFADGGYSARNAATRTPYLPEYAVTEGSRGQVNLNASRVAEAIAQTRARGMQLAVHANGERAQDEVCAGVVHVGQVDDPRLQTRIEHGGNFITEKITVDGWREAGILPVPQPVFLYNFGDFFPVYLGDPGLHGRFPFRALLDDGWKLSGSSDLMIGSEQRQTNPLFSIWCCLKRETFFGEVIDPEQRITMDEALRMHTLDGALAIGKERDRGSLEAGKLADIIVLAEDPYDVDVDHLPDIAVDLVYVGGDLVHDRLAATV
jgi:predicted amidohydrolase YtcJ